MKKILSLVLGLLWALPVLAQENYLSALSLSGTFVTGAEKPYKIPVRVSNGETSQTGYIYADAPVYKLRNYADVVDFQTGKIARNIKKDVFTGAEAWGYSGYAPGKLFIFNNDAKKELVLGASNYYQFVNNISTDMPDKSFSIQGYSTTQNGIFLNDKSYTSAAAWKAHLTELYNAGQPLEIYVVTNTPTTEQFDLSTLPQMSGNVTYQVIFPEPQIKIATTKYNETKFSPLNTALANAISVVDTVVSNTITQAGRIATLQTQKQTRPNDIADDNEKCPAGKKCLLVEDASGIPHWYEIVSGRLPDGYTELEYIESTGTQYIDTGVKTGSATSYGYDLTYQYTELLSGTANGVTIVGIRQTNSAGGWGNLYWTNYTGYTHGRSIFGGLPNSVIQYFEDATNTTTVYTTSFDANKTTRAWSITDSVSGSFSGILDRPFDCTDLNVYLFRFNSGTQTPSQIPKVRVYSFIMRIDGNVVRDFVPALNPDGKIGMYDLVRGQFYENAGTGEFIAGQPVFN